MASVSQPCPRPRARAQHHQQQQRFWSLALRPGRREAVVPRADLLVACAALAPAGSVLEPGRSVLVCCAAGARQQQQQKQQQRTVLGSLASGRCDQIALGLTFSAGCEVAFWLESANTNRVCLSGTFAPGGGGAPAVAPAAAEARAQAEGSVSVSVSDSDGDFANDTDDSSSSVSSSIVDSDELLREVSKLRSAWRRSQRTQKKQGDRDVTAVAAAPAAAPAQATPPSRKRKVQGGGGGAEVDAAPAPTSPTNAEEESEAGGSAAKGTTTTTPTTTTTTTPKKKKKKNKKKKKRASVQSPETPGAGDARRAQQPSPSAGDADAAGPARRPLVPSTPLADLRLRPQRIEVTASRAPPPDARGKQGAGPAAPAAPLFTPRKRLPNGLVIEELHIGHGARAQPGRAVSVKYEARLGSTGQQFDSASGAKPLTFRLGNRQVINGLDLGLHGMRVGGRRRLIIPPALAYSKVGAPEAGIPPNATLEFTVELVDA